MIRNDLIYGLDAVAFAGDLLNFKADGWQARVLRWEGKRMLLNCSRQSGKSTTTAVLALHRALYYPGSLILLISPSLRQSSELFRKVTDFQKLMPFKSKLVEDNKLSLTMDNGSRILSLPASGATIRGFSAVSLIIEDEAAHVEDQLYMSVRPMLAVGQGKIILMSTPFGKRGHFHSEWTEGGDTWERIEVKAAECSRISSEFLAEEKRSLGEWWFRQEYCCEFCDTTDQLFTYDMVQQAIDNTIEVMKF